jgi:hypothetical protein
MVFILHLSFGEWAIAFDKPTHDTLRHSSTPGLAARVPEKAGLPSLLANPIDAEYYRTNKSLRV